MPASSATGLSAVPAAESPSRSSSFDGLGGNRVMLLREAKIPFSESSTPRASGLLQNRGSTRYFSTKTKKAKTSDLSTKSHTHWEDCFKTNFFSLVNFRTPLSPKALCPLAEPLPPDSVDATGVDEAGVTTELTARLLEGEGGLRRRKAIKNKHKTSEGVVRTHLSLLPAEAVLRF